MSKTGVVHRIWALLTREERRKSVLLLALMIVGMALETLGVSLVVPAIAVLTDPEAARHFPSLQRLLPGPGAASRDSLAIWAMAALVGVYLFKTLFLIFLAWYQTRFVFTVQAHLSQRLFTTYLRQPYTFHLQRNSAQLIRNAVTEPRRWAADYV